MRAFLHAATAAIATLLDRDTSSRIFLEPLDHSPPKVSRWRYRSKGRYTPAGHRRNCGDLGVNPKSVIRQARLGNRKAQQLIAERRLATA